MKVRRLTTRDRHLLTTEDLHRLTTMGDRHHLLPSTKILHPHPHRVPMTAPSVPAFPSVDAAVDLTMEDIMDITVDLTATNAAAAGADAVVEAGVVVADAGVANVAGTLGALATST